MTDLGDTRAGGLAGLDFSQQYWIRTQRKNVDGTYTLIGTRDQLSIVPYALWSESMSDSSVTTAMIQAGAVTTDKLAAGAVDTTAILDGTIGSADLAEGSVTTTKIALGAVTEEKLATGAVTSVRILDGTIATADLADVAVTDAQITGSISGTKISAAGLNADTLDGIDSTRDR